MNKKQNTINVDLNMVERRLKKRGYFFKRLDGNVKRFDICFCWDKCFFARNLTEKQLDRASELIECDKLEKALTELNQIPQPFKQPIEERYD